MTPRGCLWDKRATSSRRPEEPPGGDVSLRCPSCGHPNRTDRRYCAACCYDIRKSGGSGTSPLGSHCGAGAPRFDVVDSLGNVHFVGCSSPPPTVAGTSTGWVRLRWGPLQLAAAFPPILATTVVDRIVIVFDEGQDASGGPDSFGAAILDNIENTTLVGHGDTNAS